VKHLIFILILVGLTTGCASNKTQQQLDAHSTYTAQESIPDNENTTETSSDPLDPFEGFNRAMWDFNYDILDKYVLKPVTKGYVAVMPQPVRSGLIRRWVLSAFSMWQQRWILNPKKNHLVKC